MGSTTSTAFASAVRGDADFVVAGVEPPAPPGATTGGCSCSVIVGPAPETPELGGALLVLSSGGVTVAAAFGVGAATGVAMSLSSLALLLVLLPKGPVDRLRPDRVLVLVVVPPATAPAPEEAEVASSPSPPTVTPSARSGVANDTVAETVAEGESSVLVVVGGSRWIFFERVLARLFIVVNFFWVAEFVKNGKGEERLVNLVVQCCDDRRGYIASMKAYHAKKRNRNPDIPIFLPHGTSRRLSPSSNGLTN